MDQFLCIISAKTRRVKKFSFTRMISIIILCTVFFFLNLGCEDNFHKTSLLKHIRALSTSTSITPQQEEDLSNFYYNINNIIQDVKGICYLKSKPLTFSKEVQENQEIKDDLSHQELNAWSLKIRRHTKVNKASTICNEELRLWCTPSLPNEPQEHMLLHRQCEQHSDDQLKSNKKPLQKMKSQEVNARCVNRSNTLWLGGLNEVWPLFEHHAQVQQCHSYFIAPLLTWLIPPAPLWELTVSTSSLPASTSSSKSIANAQPFQIQPEKLEKLEELEIQLSAHIDQWTQETIPWNDHLAPKDQSPSSFLVLKSGTEQSQVKSIYGKIKLRRRANHQGREVMTLRGLSLEVEVEGLIQNVPSPQPFLSQTTYTLTTLNEPVPPLSDLKFSSIKRRLELPRSLQEMLRSLNKDKSKRDKRDKRDKSKRDKRDKSERDKSKGDL